MSVAPPRARPSNGGRPQSRFPGELISVPAVVSPHHSGGPPALSTGHSTPRAPAASDHNPGSTSSARAGLRHAHAPTPPKQSSAALGVVTYQKPSLEIDDLLRILDEHGLELGSNVARSYTFRPQTLFEQGQDITGSVFVEPSRHQQLRMGHHGAFSLSDQWKSSGGMKGGTVLSTGTTRPGQAVRKFRRRYGRVCNGENSLKFQRYTEVDGQTQKDSGEVTIYYVLPDQSPDEMRTMRQLEHVASTTGKAAGQLKTSPAYSLGAPGAHGQGIAGSTARRSVPGPLKIGPTPELTVPLLELCVGPSDKDVAPTHFIDFVADGQMRGAIEHSGTGGVHINSSSGDFGEWHEQEDPLEVLPPGSVVGFINAKVGLRTSGAALLGVVSDRAIIVGSKPGIHEASAPEGRPPGIVVAYCGRVPVRVEGSCRSGDPLVPSERGDGVARALRAGESCDVWQACDVRCAGMPLDPSEAQRRYSPTSAQVVAVATQDSAHSGVALVEAVISPPAMTRRVVQSLHGTSRAQSARQGFKAAVLGLLALLLLAACYTTDGRWPHAPPSAPHQSGAADSNQRTSSMMAIHPTTITIRDPSTHRPAPNKSADVIKHFGIGDQSRRSATIRDPSLDAEISDRRSVTIRDPSIDYYATHSVHGGGTSTDINRVKLTLGAGFEVTTRPTTAPTVAKTMQAQAAGGTAPRITTPAPTPLVGGSLGGWLSVAAARAAAAASTVKAAEERRSGTATQPPRVRCNWKAYPATGCPAASAADHGSSSKPRCGTSDGQLFTCMQIPSGVVRVADRWIAGRSHQGVTVVTSASHIRESTRKPTLPKKPVFPALKPVLIHGPINSTNVSKGQYLNAFLGENTLAKGAKGAALTKKPTVGKGAAWGGGGAGAQAQANMMSDSIGNATLGKANKAFSSQYNYCLLCGTSEMCYIDNDQKPIPRTYRFVGLGACAVCSDGSPVAKCFATRGYTPGKGPKHPSKLDCCMKGAWRIEKVNGTAPTDIYSL